MTSTKPIRGWRHLRSYSGRVDSRNRSDEVARSIDWRHQIMAVINDYDQALKLSSTGFFVTFLLDRCLESTVRSLRSPSAPVNGWQTVLMGVSFVAVLIAPPCLAYALLLTNGGDLSSAVCQTLPTFWMCGKVCGSLVGSSTVIDRVRAALRDSTVANSNDDARIVEVRAVRWNNFK